MRVKNWSLILAGVALGISLSAVGCAGKSKGSTTPKPAAPAPPPETLTMTVGVTPPKPPPKPPPPPPPAPVVVSPCDALQASLTSLRVHFDFDRYAISPAAVGEVDALSSAIKAGGVGAAARYKIEGHTDATGTDGYNVPLSERRAQSVLDRLADLGAITKNQADTVGWGKQKPLDLSSTPEAFAANRRVEVVVSCPAK